MTDRIPAEDIDLSSIDFWAQPGEEREARFAALRRERPISFHEEFEPPPELPLPRGPGYWALTRHADVLAASRDARRVLLGQGHATSPTCPSRASTSSSAR